MALPLPQQLSTDPNVNASAMAWAAQLVDALSHGIAGHKVAFGVDAVVFTAADSSAQLTVPHGLKVEPILVLAMPRAATNARLTIQETAGPDATNFYVKGFQTQGTAITATQNFYWLAIA